MKLSTVDKIVLGVIAVVILVLGYEAMTGIMFLINSVTVVS